MENDASEKAISRDPSLREFLSEINFVARRGGFYFIAMFFGAMLIMLYVKIALNSTSPHSVLFVFIPFKDIDKIIALVLTIISIYYSNEIMRRGNQNYSEWTDADTTNEMKDEKTNPRLLLQDFLLRKEIFFFIAIFYTIPFTIYILFIKQVYLGNHEIIKFFQLFISFICGIVFLFYFSLLLPISFLSPYDPQKPIMRSVHNMIKLNLKISNDNKFIIFSINLAIICALIFTYLISLLLKTLFLYFITKYFQDQKSNTLLYKLANETPLDFFKIFAAIFVFTSLTVTFKKITFSTPDPVSKVFE